MKNFQSILEKSILISIATVSILIAILDFTDAIDNFPWLSERVPIMIILLIGFLAFYHISERSQVLSKLSNLKNEMTSLRTDRIRNFEIINHINQMNPDYQKFVFEFTKVLATISKFNNDLFHRGIEREINELYFKLDKWKRLRISLSKNEYNYFAIKLYEYAKESVFATCIVKYMPIWKDEVGKKLLKANEESISTTERVFIFNTLSEVTEEYIEIMSEHEKCGIQVLVYVEEIGPNIVYPHDSIKDFTVIDRGHIIGITLGFKDENWSAEWIFEDEIETSNFQSAMEKIKECSITLEKLKFMVAKNELVK